MGVLFTRFAVRSLRWAAISTLLFGALGCTRPVLRLKAGPREYVAADYQQVLRNWTRSADLVSLSELDDLLTVTATFESYDFRWAYVIRYAQDYRLTVTQRKLLLENTLGETGRHHQFYVALYGANPRWTDLTRSNTAWIVRLIDEVGNETAPEEIIPIKKPGAIEMTYFPYTTVWRQVFRIRFPVMYNEAPTISDRSHWFGLRFAGAQGNVELRWDVVPADFGG